MLTSVAYFSALRVRQWERDRRERFNTLMVALAKLLPDFHKDNDKSLAEAKANSNTAATKQAETKGAAAPQPVLRAG